MYDVTQPCSASSCPNFKAAEQSVWSYFCLGKYDVTFTEDRRVKVLINDKRPDLVSLTETWIYDSDAYDRHLHIPSNNLILKNRALGIHGGVGLYIIIRSSSKP